MKNLVSWDMTSHPKSLEYAVMVLWCIVCDVATLVCVCVCVLSEGIHDSSICEC